MDRTDGQDAPRLRRQSPRVPDAIDAKIDAALASYPPRALPPDFDQRLRARLVAETMPRRMAAPVWRLSLFDLTLVVFFTVFLLSILYTLWWAVSLIEFDWLGLQATLEQLAAENGATADAWWTVLLIALVYCQAAALTIWLLLWWDKNTRPAIATRAPSEQASASGG